MEPLAEGDPQQVGAYRLQARLGAGGMGRVFLGRSPAGRAVAVKVVHPELARDPEFRARFRREVRAAQAVSGAFTAPVVAAGPDDDPPWLATVFVAGPSLSDVIAQAGPLTEEAVWRLGGGLVEALQAVHACGLVHRDLKPGNVLIAADGPRLIDFGIARAIEGTSLTSSRVIIGTPVFMAPEQARGGLPDAAGDVFALGSVLAYAATGRAPFAAHDPVAVIYRIVHDEPDLDGLGPSLRDLVGSCLAKEPAGRPTLGALLDAVVAGSAPYPAAESTAFWPDPLAGLVSTRPGAPGAGVLIDTGPRPGPGSPPATPDRAEPAPSPVPSAEPEPEPSPGPAAAPGPPKAAEPAAARAPATARVRRAAGGQEATRTVHQRPLAGVPADVAAEAAEYAAAGDRLCAAGQYPAAEDAYRFAIAVAPDFAYAHASLAIPLCAAGRYAEADAACRAAIELAPSSAIGHHNLGYVLSEQRKHAEAAAAYAEAIRLDPGDPAGYNALGDSLCLQGRFAEAERAYRQAISHDQRSAVSYANLGHVLFEMHRDSDSVAAYHRAIQFNPGDPAVYQSLGDILFELDRDYEAESAYRQAVRLAPGDPGAHRALGEFLQATGRRKEAAAELRAARRLRR